MIVHAPYGGLILLFFTMASTYITKQQRKILIDSYMECADEMGLDDLDETQARLEKLSNTKLIAECVAFMPDCLQEI